MEENERKYQILPGVKLPDYKTLKEASSDFEISGLEDVNFKAPVTMSDSQATRENLSAEDVKRLMELGDEVADNEERQAEESKRKMQAILQNAVTQSATLDDLKKSAILQASDEKRAELEQREKEEAAKKAAAEEAEAAPAETPEAAKAEEQPAEEEEIIPETDIDSTGVIVSDEQTFEDFGEFLDEGNNDN